jgi:hypothetical protein
MKKSQVLSFFITGLASLVAMSIAGFALALFFGIYGLG